MNRVITSTLAAALLMAGFTVTAPAEEKEGVIATRKERQRKRIANGVANGSMTAKETARVENQEHHVNQEIHADRKANGGNLTNKEKVQVNNQQNRLSKEIYRDKHNGQNQQQ